MEQLNNIASNNSPNNTELPKNNSKNSFQKTYFFIIFIVVVGILFFGLIVLTSFNKTKQDIGVTSSISPTSTQLRPLSKEFVSNAVAIVKGKKLILVDPYTPYQEEIMLTVDRCDSIKSIKWSPDKHKIAYGIIKRREDRELTSFCDLNDLNSGFEFGYINLENRKVTKLDQGWDVFENNLVAYSWADNSMGLFYINKDKFQKFDLTNNKIGLIRKYGNIAYTIDYPSSFRAIGDEIYFLGDDLIGKFDIDSPEKITEIYEKHADSRGWGLAINDFIISPDGGKILYELYIPSGRSINLINLKTNTNKRILTYCREREKSPYTGRDGLGSFSPDSSMFTLYNSCSRDYNLAVYSSNGNLLKTFPHKNSKELISQIEKTNKGFSEYDYSTKFDSFSDDSKKLLLINNKRENSDTKDNYDEILTQYAFVMDLKDNFVSKISLIGTDTPRTFNTTKDNAALSNESLIDEISDAKWSD